MVSAHIRTTAALIIFAAVLARTTGAAVEPSSSSSSTRDKPDNNKTTDLAAAGEVESPETITDLAKYIVAQVVEANSLGPAAETRQGNPITPIPILLGGNTCVLCTLLSDLLLGVLTFVAGSVQGVFRLVGVPFLNLVVTLSSPFILVARVIINFTSIVTGMVARALQPLNGNADPNSYLTTYWGLTNALAYALLFWPARILIEDVVVPFFG